MSDLIRTAKKVAHWLHNADLEDPKSGGEAQDLANELETAINELVDPIKPGDLPREFGKALRKAGYIESKPRKEKVNENIST
jgi:hypothetical protein